MEYNQDNPTRSIRNLQGTLAMRLQERLQRTLQMPEGSSSADSSLSVRLDPLADLFFLIGWLTHHNGWLAHVND